MKKYKIEKYSDEIKTVQILRETEKSVFFNRFSNSSEFRELKRTEWHCYFDSFEEAKKYLLDRFKNKITSLKKQLNKAEMSFEKIINLKEI